MPSTPQSVPTVVLFDYLKDNANNALIGERIIVTLNAPSPITTISPLVVLTTTQQQTTTDGNGYWQFSLVPNTNISPANTVYTVQTPAGTYDVTLGSVGPYQSTAVGTIVNVPVPLQPAMAGTVQVGGLLVTAGEPGIDTIAAGALLIADNTATSVEAGSGATPFALQGDVATRSLTVLPTGPYTPTALAGGEDLSAALRIAGGKPWFDVTHPTYGADPTGVADSTTAIQAALTAVPTQGGVVYFPPGVYLISASLVPKSNTTLQGAGMGIQALDGASQIKGPAMTTALIDPGAGAVRSIALRQLNFNGNETGSGSKGVHYTNCTNPIMQDCFFSGFADNAVLIDGGSGGVFSNIFIQRSHMIRTGKASLTGCFDIAADCLMYAVQASASMAPTDPIGTNTIAGIVVRANGLCIDCVTEAAHIGFATSSIQSIGRFIGCRAEFNVGRGWLVAGNTSQFVGCISWANGLTTDNTYPGFNVTGWGNTFSACYVENRSTDTNQMSVGFLDNNSQAGLPNYYDGNRVGVNIRGAFRTVSGATNPIGIDFTGNGASTALAIVTALGQQSFTITDPSTVAGFQLINSGGSKFLRTAGTMFQMINAANTIVLMQVSDVGGVSFTAGQSIDTFAAGTFAIGAGNMTALTLAPDVTFAKHLIASASGTPATSGLVANLTSATFTGNDTRGTIALVVAAGGIVAGSSLATCTFNVSYGATAPKIIVVDETSNAIAGFVGFYIVSQSTGVSFVLGNSQALVTGTYTVGYIVIG